MLGSFSNRTRVILFKDMEGFILKTLKKIRKEAPRRLKELRTVCDELIGECQMNDIVLTYIEFSIVSY